ncbi:pyrroline-5-carboxylate reductase [Aquibacillus salsiterrae]|uniref:Pyrroline-5-carboxylate reductase n=1 Tax=Aquibacillus salsiterrae TaxID=2950439 RepID=A0A9X4AFD0_9BACI|nr:pyrroline-5-carboxylate reductase [Aquibacillus salsiterrae]MDC3417746.1 pyrroline-5-carboxylate reductase [Aquibacillus salsiterrae]
MVNKIAFIGAGSMAEAILAGIVAKEVLPAKQISVTNRQNQDRLNVLVNQYGVFASTNKEEVVSGADVVILSMKPKDVEAAIATVKPYIKEDQLVISVLAGVSTDFLSEQLSSSVPVIRTMPNTSATIGQSATAIAAGKFATDDHVAKAAELLTAIGTTTVVEEKDLHTITGLSGSGPAYFYYMVEAMETAAVNAGIDEKIAKELALQTISGAAQMLKQTGENPSELRKKITSPGGTTQAAIETLDQFKFQEAIEACITNAAKRSEEMGAAFKISK